MPTNKNLPDDSFTGGVWKHSPHIVECVACHARGTSIGRGLGWRQVNGVTVCDRDVCYDAVVEMFRKAMEEQVQVQAQPLPPTLEEVEEQVELEAVDEAETSEDEEPPPPLDYQI